MLFLKLSVKMILIKFFWRVIALKCPYCNEEMILGYIRSPQEISWRTKKDVLTNVADKSKGDVILAEGNILRGSTLIAYNCSKCKKIIIDYDKSNM